MLQKYTCDWETGAHRTGERVRFLLAREELPPHPCWEWRHLVLGTVLGMAGNTKKMKFQGYKDGAIVSRKLDLKSKSCVCILPHQL